MSRDAAMLLVGRSSLRGMGVLFLPLHFADEVWPRKLRRTRQLLTNMLRLYRHDMGDAAPSQDAEGITAMRVGIMA